MYYRTLAALCLAVSVALTPMKSQAETLLDTGQYFEGTWTCKTDHGSFAIHNYRIELGDRWLTMHNRFEMPGGATGEYDEYYGYEPGAKTWQFRQFGSDGTLTSATSSGWAGASWRFTGSRRDDAKTVPWRMTYVRFGPIKFQRKIEYQAQNAWKPLSGELCEKK